MCRYLLRRCDNTPAPWDSGTVGDGPWTDDLPAEATEEMKNGKDVHKPKGQPFWDYEKNEGQWKWVRPAPVAAEKRVSVKKPTAKREESSVRINFISCSDMKAVQDVACSHQ
jgi:hypothetical protein